LELVPKISSAPVLSSVAAIVCSDPGITSHGDQVLALGPSAPVEDHVIAVDPEQFDLPITVSGCGDRRQRAVHLLPRRPAQRVRVLAPLEDLPGGIRADHFQPVIEKASSR